MSFRAVNAVWTALATQINFIKQFLEQEGHAGVPTNNSTELI